MDATWEIDGESARFRTDLVSGRFQTAGHYQGLRELVHRPTGVSLAAGETLPGLVSPYRVFAGGRRFGDLRDRPTRAAVEGGCLRVTHPADEANPFELEARYAWRGGVLDVAYTLAAAADLPDFEMGVASYFAGGFRAFVSRQSNVWGEPGARIVPVDTNPMTDVYALFPRGEAALRTIFDGRWDLPPYPVRYTVPGYFAHPLAYRRHGRSGVMAVGLADPAECLAVCVPVNDPPDDPDPARGYQAIYFYYFGRDVRRGETVGARLRWVVGHDLTDSEVMDRWHAFAGGA